MPEKMAKVQIYAVLSCQPCPIDGVLKSKPDLPNRFSNSRLKNAFCWLSRYSFQFPTFPFLRNDCWVTWLSHMSPVRSIGSRRGMPTNHLNDSWNKEMKFSSFSIHQNSEFIISFVIQIRLPSRKIVWFWFLRRDSL